MRRISERCEAAQRARVLLQAAHDACFKAPDRDILGMSHGPFSGVNEVLGLIAEMDEQIGRADVRLASAIEAADEAATERERERCAALLDRYENGLAQVWRHKKSGGLYRIINHVQIEATMTPAVTYMAIGGGTIWVRPLTEFNDGRFEKVEDAAIRKGGVND